MNNQLAIFNGTKLLWESFSDKPWILAAKGKEKISAYRGSFQIKDKVDNIICSQQIVNNIEKKR